MSCRDLARAGRFLIGPEEGAAVCRAPHRRRRIRAVMRTCGLYDAAGDFAYRVGLPAKSGVGGGVLAVSPGKYSVMRLVARARRRRGIRSQAFARWKMLTDALETRVIIGDVSQRAARDADAIRKTAASCRSLLSGGWQSSRRRSSCAKSRSRSRASAPLARSNAHRRRAGPLRRLRRRRVGSAGLETKARADRRVGPVRGTFARLKATPSKPRRDRGRRSGRCGSIRRTPEIESR